MPKRYTEEFEKETVRLALTSGRSQSSIRRALGVSRTTVVRWLAGHREQDGGPGTFPAHVEAPDRAELPIG